MRKILCIVLFITLAFPLAGHAAGHAQRPDAPTYARRGPYPVGTQELTIDDGQGVPLSATVWYPALNPDGVEESVIYRVLLMGLEGRAIRDAAPDTASGPYPLVVFSHGSGGLRYNSLWLTEHLASHGFVVIAADHPGNTVLDTLQDPAQFAADILASLATRPLDVLREIAAVESFTAEGGATAESGALAGLVDMDRIAVAGHSLGGYTALSVGGARLDLDQLAVWCASEPEFPPPPEGIPARDLSPDDLAQARAEACFNPSAIEDVEHLPQGALTPRTIPEIAAEMAALRGLDSPPEGLWPATTDPRVRAVVALAPALGPAFGPEGLAALTVPTLILVGSADQSTVPERDAYPVYQGIGSADKALGVFENAGHYVFIDACSNVMIQFGLFWGCSDMVWDMARVHDLSNHLVTAFLLAELYNDADAAAVLAPGAVDFAGVDYIAVER